MVIVIRELVAVSSITQSSILPMQSNVESAIHKVPYRRQKIILKSSPGVKYEVAIDGVLVNTSHKHKTFLKRVGDDLLIVLPDEMLLPLASIGEADSIQPSSIVLQDFYITEGVGLAGDAWDLSYAEGLVYDPSMQAIKTEGVSVGSLNLDGAFNPVLIGFGVLFSVGLLVKCGGRIQSTMTTIKYESLIDTAPPTAPVVNTLTTSDTTPTISGTAKLLAGESLSVTVNGATYNSGSDSGCLEY